jgi:hypothetical protein
MVNPAAGTGLPLPSNKEIAAAAAAAATGVPRTNQQMPANELNAAFKTIEVPQGQPQPQEIRQPQPVAVPA